DEGDLLVVAEVGEPVPGEHALAGDDQPVTERLYGLEEGVGRGGQGDGEGGLAGRVEGGQGEGSGGQSIAAVGSVVLVVESHHGLRVKGYLLLVTSSMPVAKRP